MIEVRVLGPLAIHEGPQQIELGPSGVHHVLAALGLRRARPVSAEALADVLWHGAPPATAPAALRNRIAQLRRTLGPSAVQTRSNGYQLDPAVVTFDVDAFRQGVQRATQAQDLTDVLALWRGEPWEDTPDDPLAVVEAAQLHALRRSAMERRGQLQWTVGQLHELRTDSHAAVAAGDVNEVTFRLLMAAEHLLGNPREALLIGHRYRRTLADRSGLRPSATFGQLETAIARGDENALRLICNAPAERTLHRSSARSEGHRATR